MRLLAPRTAVLVVLVLGLLGCSGGSDEASDASVPDPEPSTTTPALMTTTTVAPYDCPLDRVDVEGVFQAGPMPFSRQQGPDSCTFTSLDVDGFPYGLPSVTFRVRDPGEGYAPEQLILDRAEYALDSGGGYGGLGEPVSERGPAARALTDDPTPEALAGTQGPVPRRRLLMYVEGGHVQEIEVVGDGRFVGQDVLHRWSNDLAELL